MKDELSCEVVRDLLPSYIDGLTAPVTNEAVGRHIKQCGACRQTLDAMRAKQEAPVESQPEIDYLKKNRERSRRRALCAAAVCTLLVIGAFLFQKFFCGERIRDVRMVDYTIVSVSDNELVLMGELVDSAKGVYAVRYAEENGILRVTMEQTAASVFHRNYFYERYKGEEAFTQIQLNGRVIWDQGQEISPKVAETYAAGHPYLGDMSANGKTMMALGVPETLGAFKNELQTRTEPFGWKLLLQNSFDGKQLEHVEEKMQDYACVLIATIDNLEYVVFSYTADGQERELTVDRADADARCGGSVKELAKTPSGLQQLMQTVNLAEGRLYGIAQAD